MKSIVLNSSQQSVFAGANRELRVYDESGKLLGYLVSLEVYTRFSAPTGAIPFTKDEVDAFRKSGGGTSLNELWKTMGVR
jgi:hypothetical protein